MRQKESGQVRDDALRMARDKLDAGCVGCAQGYAQLAVEHGATRRQFLRLGLGGLAAAAIAGTAVLTQTKGASADWCYYEWGCLFGNQTVTQICCHQVFLGTAWITACWIASVNNTGWNC